MTFRIATLDEMHLFQAAQLWNNGWHEAHAKIVPSKLVALRTIESFKRRLKDDTVYPRVCIQDDEVLGLCITRENELYQIYVSPKARGRGVAPALMMDAESSLLETGYLSAWLACAMGNDQAARFYKKSGWHNTGERTVELETSQGAFSLKVWKFVKSLRHL
ncbi:GNAT family N-acetyltransferase [Yoonia maritima]|uniref:GNAT family N-acetyltransferase n=1 Tax=Yoonia maritima TaxID=1435347 RepID=UPI003735302B